ncbi:hypothetical protein AC477_00205 [miscellaneous Crenarchaeota group-1 archaeon SG8-32-1]|jgi:hypothetical protein|uniref:Uncharacterized protein n=1 Tax=miscellaneous Crenarchaeota group-1 archaeon SG8-32-1 TaxID=1685124 RepID=A0A0M0C1A8_9ARCH|nr:MAG: hypothetical protein AC477_00205 [miscellaneous Crenarchaeota group-1 archaeon SG8-32-1]
MTCYFRHLKTVFEKAGITITIENKGKIDKAIHQIAGIKYKNCSATWKVVKKKIIEDEENFVKTLKKSVKD